ncbi:MAG: hypothetical protein VB862_08575, partial [Pirellulaceae bacterium]
MSHFRARLRQCSWLVGTLFLSLGSSFVAVQGQEQTTVDPKPYGFDIPAGVLQLGSGQRVTTVDAAGRSVVAKVYLTIGDYQVLLFPDGQLAAL